MRCIQAERRLVYVHLRQEARHRGCKLRPLGLSSIGWRHPIGICPSLCFILPEHFAAMLHRACGHSSRQYYIGVLQPVLSPFCVQASVCSIRDLSVLMLRLRTPKRILGNVETNDSTTDVRSLTGVFNHPEVRTSLVTFMHQAVETETAGGSGYVSKSAASAVPSS